jgi:tetratricopeptide (TPR) repeat protein
MRVPQSVVLLALSVCVAFPSAGAQTRTTTAPAVTAAQSRTLDSLRAVVNGAGTPAKRASAAIEWAEALRVAGQHDQVFPAHRRAVELAVEAADSTILAMAFHTMGIEYWRRRQYDSALVHLEHTRTLRTLIGDRPGLGRTLNSTGAAYYQLGIYEQALDAFTQAAELRREQHDSLGVARTLTNIGKTYHDWGQYERARAVFDEAVAIATKIDSQVPLGYALNSLAALNIDAGDLPKARAQLAQSIAAYDRASARFTPSDSASVWALNSETSAELLLHEGRAATALPLLDSLLAASERLQADDGIARASLLLGQAHGVLGDPVRARRYLASALDASRRVGTRMLTLEVLRHSAAFEESSSTPTAALPFLHAYQALRDTIFNQTAAKRIAVMEARAATERQLRENDRLRRRIGIGSTALLAAAALLALAAYYGRKVRAHAASVERANADLARANEELRTALVEVRTLKGLIPICAWCKKVRDDEGYWESVETYVAARSEASFSHGICSSCAATLEAADKTDPTHAPPADPHR